MVKTIYKNEFIEILKEGNSSFSTEGAEALYEYLTDLEDDCDMTINLSEGDLSYEYDEEELEQVLIDKCCENIDELREKTTVIELKDNRIVYMSNF
jgi:alcohol dehydrogenase class IV